MSDSDSPTSTPTADLWPIPSRPPFPTSPGRIPGSNDYESTQALREILKDNHERWHIFFDDLPRHNHITHHLLAIWAMGANGDTLRKVYKHDIQIQRPIGTSPGRISKENVYEHVGDPQYYKAYLDFFESSIREYGPTKVMEEYIFSYDANYGAGKPEMMARMMAGLGHGLIHLGYGAEFGLPGMFVEGLAQAAVSTWPSACIHPPALFQQDFTDTGKPLHAFTIISNILSDERFATRGEHVMEMWSEALQIGDAVYELVEKWLPSASDSDVEKKIEELHWTATLLYAVSGYKRGEREMVGNESKREFNADFVSMHFITATTFLTSLIPLLSPRSGVVLLRSSFGMMLLWWIALGRPKLHVAEFCEESISYPSTAASSTNTNPWLDVIQQALVHPDDHLPKLVRSLLHFADLYGSTPSGTFQGTELEGAENIDGTLFLKAVLLTLKRLDKFESPEGGLPEYLVYGWDFKSFREGLKGPMI